MSGDETREGRAGALALLDELTELRVATFARHPTFRVDTGRAATRAWLERGLACVDAGAGELLTRREASSGRLLAAAGYWHLEAGWHGSPVQVGLIEHVPARADAIDFVVQAMIGLWPQLGPRFELTLSAAYPEVREALVALGLGIDSLELLGEPRRALARLVERYDPPRTLAHLGLRLERQRAPERAEEVVALQLEFFRRHPEYCWFYAYPGFAERQVASLAQDLETGLHYLITTPSGELVGSFGADLEVDNAMWGHRAGMDLMLAESVQGLGIAKTAYRVLLEEMVARGVEVFKGGTSQPAVLGLGRLMERPLLGVMMRFGTLFGPGHFGL